MTTDEQDRFLEELFADQAVEVTANGFTEGVIAETSRIRQLRLFAVVAAGVFAFVLAMVFATPLMAMTLVLVNTLATPLILLQGWLGFVLAPINNVGALLLVFARIMRMFWRYVARVRFSS